MRKLNEIANEIMVKWPTCSNYAWPYLDAMLTLNSINDNYYADTARSVVIYFLSNATHRRGADARRLKAELKEMLK